jgi:hypothetical protein
LLAKISQVWKFANFLAARAPDGLFENLDLHPYNHVSNSGKNAGEILFENGFFY